MITFGLRYSLLAALGIAGMLAGFVTTPAVAQTSRPPITRAPSPPNNFRGPPLPNASPPKPPTNPEFERKKAENSKWLDQKQREAKAEMDRRSEAVRQKMAKASQPVPFNPTSAPPPDECLRAFIAAGRTATSIEQLMRFLPQAEVERLKAHQASYDPKHAASAREWHRKQDPTISDESLDHITGPPDNFALKFHKGLANHILDILSVKVEGNKASLVVSTNSGATVNGEHFGYGTADVEMVGEGNYWKLSRYSPSIMVYKEAPHAP